MKAIPGGASEKHRDQLDDLIKVKSDNIIAHLGTNDIANNVNLLNKIKKIFKKVF